MYGHKLKQFGLKLTLNHVYIVVVAAETMAIITLDCVYACKFFLWERGSSLPVKPLVEKVSFLAKPSKMLLYASNFLGMSAKERTKIKNRIQKNLEERN